MRCVVIVDAFPHHTETFIKDHVDRLGADVFSIYCPHGAVDSWQWRARPFVASVYGFVPPRRTLFRRALARARETFFGLPTPSWPPEAERRWDEYVKERRPTVALAEFGPSGICALPACQRTGVPLAVHFHGYDASALLRSARYRRALKRLFAEAAAIVVVGQAMHDRLAALGCPEAKLSLIRCGATPSRFALQNRVHEQPCRFLAVSRLIPGKGVLETLRAFELCANVVAGVSLTICGDGPLSRACQRIARRSRHAPAIQLLGHVSHDRVAAEMANAGVFLQHSRTTRRIGWIEGCGLAILEASLRGLPVVATAHGGIPDIVRHEETGLLVEEGDVEGMAACMTRLARAPDLRQRMGLAARPHALEVGSQDTQIAKLQALLESLQRTIVHA